MPAPLAIPLPSPYSVTASPAISSGAELVSTDGRSLPLIGAALTGEARGGVARLVLEQRFENRHAEVLRVTYRMPLPADGAVSAYEFEIAGRVISGHIDKKAEARAQFERAIAVGQTAALLEQDRADIFTQEIGNLPPGATIVARITVDQKLVWLDEGEWELRFPTVIGPRYIGSADTIEDARATHVVVAEGGIKARIHIAIKIRDEIAGGRPASSPSHGISTGDDGVVMLDFLNLGAYRGGGGDRGARLDRDIVVRWPVARATVGLALDSARGDCELSDSAHGLLTIVPPARSVRAEALPRDLTILLDTSGSMGGVPLDTAKRVLALVIDSLGAHDRLELIEFSSSTRHYRREPVDATDPAKRAAIGWLMSREAGGGTEMRNGVLAALRPLRNGAQRQVIVVTDGYVGGEEQILEVLHDKLPSSCRLHVLGVGSAVNRSLATSLARAGRGVEVLAGPDEDPERAAARILTKTRAPMLTEVEIAGSALVDHAPEHVPDVFAGAPLVSALALRPEGGELVVRGRLPSGRWEERIRVPSRRPGEGNRALAALYARERVADLEVRAASARSTAKIDREIEELGVRYQIATRMTSWIAIDHDSYVRGPKRWEDMPQELPHGTSVQSFGMRTTGFPMQAHASQNMMALDTVSFVGEPYDFDQEEASTSR